MQHTIQRPRSNQWSGWSTRVKNAGAIPGQMDDIRSSFPSAWKIASYTYVHLFIHCLKSMLNVGKYTIHGWCYGFLNIVSWRPKWVSSHLKRKKKGPRIAWISTYLILHLHLFSDPKRPMASSSLLPAVGTKTHRTSWPRWSQAKMGDQNTTPIHPTEIDECQA